MRGEVSDFTKAFAGLFAGIFVLIIAYGMLAGIARTESWKNTIKPFDEKLGPASLMIGASLGSKDSFGIDLLISDATLGGVWFLKRDNVANCGSGCESFGGSSDAVVKCKEECHTKCGKDKGDCIMLVPTRVGNEASWYKAWEWASFWVANKPVIFSSGASFEFDFGGLQRIEVIDNYVRNDELKIYKSGSPTTESFDKTVQKCLVFTSSDKKVYRMDIKNGKCGDEKS